MSKNDNATALLAELIETIQQRRDEATNESYTSQLLHGDEDALLKKIIEEAGETALAAKGGDKIRLAQEIADVCYHCLVIMTRYNVSVEDVAAVLQKRRGQSGLAEKSARKEK
ncbi:MAG: phosphoribosyl-ATP diphosphatase [Gammaproteobacteria bacterium WSBS_2016_MAG_OTU1]